MKATRISGAFVATTLALLVTACSSGETASDSQEEEITPGGIAVIVLDHLGRDTVRQVVTFTEEDQEGEGVGVLVRLRDATRHHFGVQVFSPEQAEQYSAAGQCPREPTREVEAQCRTLDNGTTVTTRVDAQGFSDDNVDGMVISGTAITPEDGAALAMYESYDDSPAISVAELEELLIDSRLTWLTDPEVNEAGEAVDLKEVTR